jgi:hypothetical protein
MRASALRHTEMDGELATFQAAESVHGRSPDETFWVDVVGELAAEFWKLEELCSWLEQLGTRICDLLLGLPFGWARWADHLDEAAGWLGVELAARQEVDTEPEALQTSAE